MLKKFLTMAMLALIPMSLVHASVVINELMPKNVSFQVDDQFQFSGWAELYNNGAEDVDISLYFFSDSLPLPTMWQMNADGDDAILKAGEYKVVYFDESEGEDIPAFHANFKLPAKHGCLYLADESGAIIDKMPYDTTYRNISYGRIVDGEAELGFFNTPTPNAANATSSVVTKKTEAPSFDLAPGFFKSEQKVTITAPNKSAQIYYTTDGAEPTTESSPFTEPITVEKTTPIRAIAVVDGEMSSDVSTATYFINESVSKLPVVAINATPDLLYSDELGLLVAGTNGSYVNPGCNGPDDYANYMNDWDRPANFELFDKNKTERINQEVKIGNFGACSRTKYIKSIKVNAAKIYGNKKLDYPIFEEKPNLQWKSIVLRNAGNDYGRSYLRDGFIQSLMIGRGDIDHQAYQPSMVFVNGDFYGMLNIRERTNKDFIYSNYGYGEDEIYINEGNWANVDESNYGELEAICKLKDMNGPDVYEGLNMRMDINEFLNYFMIEMYCGNSDWPGGNIKCWKPKDDPSKGVYGKWRWILYDTEFSYSLYSNTVNSNCFTTAKKHKVFSGAIKNDKIREKLLGKFCVHLATTFEAKRVISVLDSLKDNITPDVNRYIAKLAKAGRIEANFDTDIITMKAFANKRVAAMYKNINKEFSVDTLPIRIYSDLKSATFSINDEPIRMSDFNGYFFTKTNCKIEANEPDGYVFDHWEYTPQGSTDSKKIKDIAYCDTFVGGSFKAVYIPDSEYDETASKIFINEICTSNSIYVDEYREADDWVEFYNSGEVDYDLSGLYVSNDAKNPGKYQIPNSDSCIVPAKSYRILWADNDPEQGVLHANFKLSAARNGEFILSSANINGKDTTFSIIDSVQFKMHRENETYARFGKYTAIGKVWKITGKPTFEKANIYGYVLDNPTVKVECNEATIYPNPVEDEISFILPYCEAIQCQICALDGTTLRTFTVSDGGRTSVANLNKGMYIMVMNTPDGVIRTKFIKK